MSINVGQYSGRHYCQVITSEKVVQELPEAGAAEMKNARDEADQISYKSDVREFYEKVEVRADPVNPDWLVKKNSSSTKQENGKLKTAGGHCGLDLATHNITTRL